MSADDARGTAAITLIRPIKRKAVITVEYEAEDHLSDKAQEREIRRTLAGLYSGFEQIDIRFADRRPRCKPRAPAPQRSWPRS